MRSWSGEVRGHVNRVVVLVGMIGLLPAIAVAERIRAGAGRRIAIRGIRAIAAIAGVRFRVIVDPATAELDAAVLVANHSSPLDIPAILLARPSARFLAAAELFRIPLLGSAVRAMGSVPIDRSDPVAAYRRVDSLAVSEPGDVAVFAEGGISHDGLGEFKRGAFRLAIASGLPVVPVAVCGSDALLGRRRRLRVRPGTITIEVAAPLSTRNLTLSDVGSLRDETRNAVLRMLERSPARSEPAA